MVRVVALLLALLVACSDETTPRTQLVLVADTDLDEADLITFEVSDLDGSLRKSATAPAAVDAVPRYVSLVRESGPLGPLTITARALAGGRVLVERVHTASFVVDETRMVPLHLLARCVGSACGADQTCTEQGCRARALDELPAWPGDAPGLDDLRDAGTDAGPDIGADGGDAGATLTRCGDAGLFDLASDPRRCGRCDRSCSNNQVCRAAKCAAK